MVLTCQHVDNSHENSVYSHCEIDFDWHFFTLTTQHFSTIWWCETKCERNRIWTRAHARNKHHDTLDVFTLIHTFCSVRLLCLCVVYCVVYIYRPNATMYERRNATHTNTMSIRVMHEHPAPTHFCWNTTKRANWTQTTIYSAAMLLYLLDWRQCARCVCVCWACVRL